MAQGRKALRGRFLRMRLCDSATVAAFIKECGPWAGMFFDRLILHSDDDGRFLAEPGVAAAKCFPHHHRSNAQIAKYLEAMERHGFIVLYADEGGSRYGAWRKWRKHQPKPRPDRYIPSELPPPPAGTTDVRSARRSARQIGGDLPDGLEPATEEEVEAEAEAEEEEVSGPPAGCPFCRKPTRGPLQHYHDRAKEVLGRCLVINPAAAGPLIARREKEVGREKCHALFEVYLASEDAFVQKGGHSLTLFGSESIFNGVMEAEAGGWVHGSKERRARPGKRRPSKSW